MSTAKLIALTRPVSATVDRCALSFVERNPIDVSRAQRQHDEYQEVLRSLGASVLSLPAEPALPDAVFVEDTAVVVDEVAVMTRPALASRRSECASTARVLAAYRRLRWVEGDAHLEGGDVLRVGKTLFVGISARTNPQGVAQLRGFLAPYGYDVVPVSVSGCLHLKSAICAVDSRTLLANPGWVDVRAFDGWGILPVASGEDFAANVVLIGDTIVMPAGFPRTEALLRERGYRVYVVDMSELQKAEGAVTCCSILFTHPDSSPSVGI